MSWVEPAEKCRKAFLKFNASFHNCSQQIFIRAVGLKRETPVYRAYYSRVLFCLLNLLFTIFEMFKMTSTLKFWGAIGGKTSKTEVLPWFCKKECGGGSGGRPPCYGGLSLPGPECRAAEVEFDVCGVCGVSLFTNLKNHNSLLIHQFSIQTFKIIINFLFHPRENQAKIMG